MTDMESQDITLDGILRKLLNIFPVDPVQTHILHLASEGEILPHVDNTSASGTYILGVSLGATRMMRVESVDSGHGSFDVLLPSGSVYVQKYLHPRKMSADVLISTFCSETSFDTDIVMPS